MAVQVRVLLALRVSVLMAAPQVRVLQASVLEASVLHASVLLVALQASVLQVRAHTV